MTTIANDDAWSALEISLPDVRDWISASLTNKPVLDADCEILNKKDWSIVAEFRCTGSGESFVYKVSTLPRMRHAPEIFGLLSRRRPGMVPDLIASRTDANGRAEMLFRKFTGHRPANLAQLLDAVRCFGQIQAAAADVSPNETASIPVVRLGDIPTYLENLLQEIEPIYDAYWDAEGGALRNQFGISKDIVENIREYQPRIQKWIDELTDFAWPASLDHVDLLPHNMVIQPDGGPLIYDWEQAEMGCPLFSLDILLAYAQDWDKSEQHGLHLDLERRTPSWLAVRDAYLEALPWGSMSERRRAFDLALCLSPIRYAHAERVMATEFGHQHYFAEDLAWWLMRAYGRWVEMD